MSTFERRLTGYRLVETHWGDDLQAVAAREMGDANRWPELVWLNSLAHPYITTNPLDVRPGVLQAGAFIKVPSASGVWTDDAERGQVYERDCQMVDRMLVVGDDGDLAVASGSDNLRQQLQHRVDTPRGQARRHPTYGSLHHRLLGTVNGPIAGMLGAQYVKAALRADYRVARVDFSRGEVVGDAIMITARAVAIEGGAVDIVAD